MMIPFVHLWLGPIASRDRSTYCRELHLAAPVSEQNSNCRYPTWPNYHSDLAGRHFHLDPHRHSLPSIQQTRHHPVRAARSFHPDLRESHESYFLRCS